MPTVLKADFVDGDGLNKVITAHGNVEVKKDTSVVYADKIIYDKKNQTIKAFGNVKIKNIEVGNMLVKKALIKDDFSSGEFFDTKLF